MLLDVPKFGGGYADQTQWLVYQSLFGEHLAGASVNRRWILCSLEECHLT